MRSPVDDEAPAPLSGRRRADAADELAHRALRWLALAALACRALVTIPTVLLVYRGDGTTGHGGLLTLAAALVLFDLLLLAGAWLRPGLLDQRWIFVADLLLTSAVNAWMTALIEPASYFEPGHDPLTGYAWGTIGLWTAVRGWRVGGAVLLGVSVGMVVLGWANGVPLTSPLFGAVPVRMLQATMVYVTAAGIEALIRQEARAVAAQSAWAGRLAARSEAMQAVHNGTLAELEAIVKLTERSTEEAAHRLRRIHEAATRSATALRAAPIGNLAGPGTGMSLPEGLAALAAEFTDRGLAVHLDDTALSGAAPDRSVVAAALSACREALNNVVKHTGVSEATIRARTDADHLRIEVIDRGGGIASRLAGYGVRQAITARMRSVGGGAAVEPATGGGTTVRLWAPIGPRSADLDEPARPARAARRMPLVVLVWRTLELPGTFALVTPYLTGQGPRLLLGALAVLLALNLALLADAWRGGNRLLSSPIVLVADLGAAVGLHLLVATQLPVGVITAIGPDFTWVYVVATVALWAAARTLIAGVVVLAGAITLMAVGAAVNRVAFDDGLALTLLNYAAFGAAMLVGFAFILRMARTAEEWAAAEATRAGREAERLENLGRLQIELIDTTDAIRDLAASPATDRGLERIRTIAVARSTELRALLDHDARAVAQTGLRAALQVVLARAHERGQRVDMQDVELRDGQPAPVIAAVVTCVGTVLERFARGSVRGQVVLWVSGDAAELDVRIRHRGVETDRGLVDEIHPELAAVRVDVDVWTAPGRGSRIQLHWEAA